MAKTRAKEFWRRLDELTRLLKNNGTLLVSSVRDEYFPGREWGTWVATAHLFARLVQIGKAQYVDRFTFAWPEGVEDGRRASR